MEDKKRKKEEKRKRETSLKVAEQKNKAVPELTKPLSGQSPATLPSSSSASPSPGPPSSASPSPATATSQGGGNNAKRVAVANGQLLTSQGPGAPQPPQQQRYMPREVPPRFRCQQDHKVLLKRGQPPLSSMLLGGGTAGGGAGGDGVPNTNMAASSDSTPGYVGPGSSSLPLTSSPIAAASSTTSSNYANSMWGAGSGSHTPSQGREKVIVDKSDLEGWPSIAGGDGGGASSRGEGGSSAIGEGCGLANSSSSASSGDQSSLTSAFPLPNECMQSGSVVWGSASQQGVTDGATVVVAGSMLPPSVSKAPTLTANQDSFLGGSRGGTTGANFNPNANPSAWPALVQQDGTPGAASSDGGPATLHSPGAGGTGALSANSPLLQNPPLSVNQSNAHQHQLLHQMQSRDREHSAAPMAGGWPEWGGGVGGVLQETGAGPKTLLGEGGGIDCMGGSGGDKLLPQTSQTSSSSFSAANSKTGACRTDDWEGEGHGVGGFRAAEGGGDGTSGWGGYTGQGGSKSWGAGSGGSESTELSQGGWGGGGGGGGGECGGSVGSGGSNPVAEAGGGGGCSSNSSSSGGSNISNPTPSSSSTSATVTRTWDNQKGEVEGGETVEWGGGQGGGRGGGGGGGTSSSSGGGNSRSGNSGGSHNQHQGSSYQGHQRFQHHPGANAEEALKNLLSRPDLDPRVLSNTGWGQTQIKQNVAWDFESAGGGSRGSGSSSLSKNTHPPSVAPQYSSGAASDSMGGGSSFPYPGQASNPGLVPQTGLSGEGWESSSTSSSSGASLPSRGHPSSGPNTRNLGGSQPGAPTTGAGMGGPGGPGQGKASGGWGGMGPNEGQGKGWGNEEGWAEARQQGNTSGGGEGGWGGSQEEKGTGGWKEMGRDGGGGWGGQRGGGGEDRGKREPKSNGGGGGGGGWGDERRGGRGNSVGDSGMSTWGSWDEGAPRRAWGGEGTGGGGDKPHQGWGDGGGGGGGKMHPSQMPDTQTTSVKGPQAPPQLQSKPQPPPQEQGAMQGGWGGRQPPPQAQNQNQSSGWTTGPIPSAPGGGSAEPSGWEEPSPQAISRKTEIDDGTSAWGDPNHYTYKPVNLWDKSSGDGSAPSGKRAPVHGQVQGQAPQQQGPPVMQQGPPVMQQSGRQPSGVGGGRDVNPGHGPGKASGMGWGGGSPSSPSVDDSTAAWGKPSDNSSGWGEPAEAGKSSGWGNPSPNPIKPAGPKSMQDGGWGEAEGSAVASRHSSWEEEEEGGGSVWSSAGSQGSSSSYNSGGWTQGQAGGKKTSSKGPLKPGGDSWMNPITRQFSNMGLLGDDPSSRPLDLAPGPQDKKMDGEKRGMGLNDYNGEMRKGSRGGGGGGMVFRSPGSKDMGPGDSGPYYDKTLPFTNQDGCLGEEGPCSAYSPPSVCKPHPLYSHTIPPRQSGHPMFGGGGGMGSSRHQPGVPPLNSSTGIRAQVPQQFLSPQVPGPILKQMTPPSGSMGGVGGVGGVGGGGVFPPQLSPQHIAMLSGIYPPPLQFQLACQLLLQQPPQQQLLQNQRKLPQNIRQQADPQQLARIMAVLQQQRQQQQVGGGGKLSPSLLGGGGLKLPMADSLAHPGLGGTLADLQQRAQGGYSGYGSGVSLSGLELGGSTVGGPGGMKDLGGQQSRFKWMMEGHSPAPSPPESTLHKNGHITPMKMQGGSPYAQYDMLGGEGLGLPPQGDHWHRTPGNKMGSKPSTSSWPPEFQPGVPWKGIPSVDPESDPYMTPGSMMGNPGLNDSEHQLLRDNAESTPPLNTLLPSHGAWPYSASDSPIPNTHNSAKYTDYKTSWPPEPIGHNKLWKANRSSHQSQLSRPPPGLANQKQPSPSPWSGGAPRMPAARGWGGPGGNQEARYGPGAAWSDGGNSRGSCWLVLSNLTPQIDGSTLRTICMQHGPLLTFHLGLTQGSALIRYSSRQEAAKAQSALHMCVLGNTTILAEFVSEEEVARYFAHSQAVGGGGAPGGSGAGGQGASGTGPAVGPNSSGGGNLPGGDRERDRPRGGEGGSAPGGSSAGGGGGGSGAPGPGWQSLDGTDGSPEPGSSQGQGLGVFAQWSNNGGVVAGVGAGAGGVDAGRQGLWGGMGGGGYPGSSLWGSPALDERLQMGSPAALLPGDLLGGGTD